MQQLQKITSRLIIRQSTHHQSLQLNRLIKFIQNKKSPSFNKLKNILTKNDPFHTDRQHRKLSIENDRKKIKNKHDQSIAVNTKNIFVAKHKTQATSSRMHFDEQTQNYKIFVTKKEILNAGQISEFLPQSIRQKINSTGNKSQNKHSNLFPSLKKPKKKRAVQFEKYQDEATKWLNSEILNMNTKSLDKEKYKKPVQGQQNKDTKIIIKNLQVERQRYNKSLQRLIEKALKNKSEHKSSNSNRIHIIQGIEGYDSKLIVSGQHYEKDHESLYAQKGRLLTNPNIKIKKNIKNRSMKKTQIQKTFTLRNPQSESKQKQKEVLDFSNLRNKQAIHTDREAHYLQSSLKLKTQISAVPVQYHPSTIKKDNRTSKLIKQLEQSMLKSQQINNRPSMKNQNFADLINRLQNNSLQKIDRSQRKQTKRKKIKEKTKTMQDESANLKTLNKWQIAGYDFIESPQDMQQNLQIQKYVQNLAKKSTKTTFYKNQK